VYGITRRHSTEDTASQLPNKHTLSTYSATVAVSTRSKPLILTACMIPLSQHHPTRVLAFLHTVKYFRFKFPATVRNKLPSSLVQIIPLLSPFHEGCLSRLSLLQWLAWPISSPEPEVVAHTSKIKATFIYCPFLLLSHSFTVRARLHLSEYLLSWRRELHDSVILLFIKQHCLVFILCWLNYLSIYITKYGLNDQSLIRSSDGESNPFTSSTPSLGFT